MVDTKSNNENTTMETYPAAAERSQRIARTVRRERIATAALFLTLALVLVGVAIGNGYNVAAGFSA